MKIVNMRSEALKLEENYFKKIKKSKDSNVIRFVSEDEEENVQKEMRLIFFSKGNIFLESEEAKFNLKTNEGLNLDDLECFGQLITVNFKKLLRECTYYKYVGSPVSFTLTFFNDSHKKLGTLISDSIFKDIGFGKGIGEWTLKDE